MNINYEINRLINFALQHNLIDKLDVVYTSNLLLEVLNLDEFEEVEVNENLQTATPILENILDYAVENGTPVNVDVAKNVCTCVFIGLIFIFVILIYAFFKNNNLKQNDTKK